MDKPFPTYSLRRIEIKNFKGITYTKIEDLPREAKWIFLTGRNGYGKTCVLQSIFIGCFGQLDYQTLLIPKGDKSIIKIGYSNNERDKNHPEYIDDTIERYDDIQRGKKYKVGPPIVAYGSSRLNIQSRSSSNIEEDQSSPSYNLFNPDGILFNIETELKTWYYRSQISNLEEKSRQNLSARYKNVRQILLNLMPNIADITIDAENDRIIYKEKDEENNVLTQGLTFNELASGNKSIIAIVGDMIIRLFKIQSTIIDPADLEGIVIIDELDLHLHPSWQKALPTLLSEIFPKIQFIASTHSPIPFLGAPENSAFLKVNRTKEEGITLEKLDLDISDLTPNLILSSPIFGFTNIIPVTHEKGERIRTEDTMQEAAMNDAIRQKLTDFLGKEKEEELKKLFKKG